MPDATHYSLKPVGFVHSSIKRRWDAPRQGREGAPDAWIEVNRTCVRGLEGITVGQEIILVTWFHQARRKLLRVRPRGDKKISLTGVFATRSPDRPNPLGLHRVKVLEIVANRLKVEPLEAIDGTPVVDIKPVLTGEVGL